MSNRTQKVDSVTGTENSSYNAANMILTRNSNSYTYDALGSVLAEVDASGNITASRAFDELSCVV